MEDSTGGGPRRPSKRLAGLAGPAPTGVTAQPAAPAEPAAVAGERDRYETRRRVEVRARALAAALARLRTREAELVAELEQLTAASADPADLAAGLAGAGLRPDELPAAVARYTS